MSRQEGGNGGQTREVASRSLRFNIQKCTTLSPPPPTGPTIAGGNRTSGYYLGEERLARTFVTPQPAFLSPVGCSDCASLNYNNAHETVRSIRDCELTAEQPIRRKDQRERVSESNVATSRSFPPRALLILLFPPLSRARDRRLM